MCIVLSVTAGFTSDLRSQNGQYGHGGYVTETTWKSGSLTFFFPFSIGRFQLR
jgi:hypothetical protein